MTMNVCLAGALGWAGSELARGIASTGDMVLISGVSRAYAGYLLADVLDDERLGCPLFATVSEALEIPCDVFVEYTGSPLAKQNILYALHRGVHVVVGTSGLTKEDCDEIEVVARARNLGVLVCTNFALSAVLLRKFSEIAASYMSQWEIVEYSNSSRVAAHSGNVREIVTSLSKVDTHETQPGEGSKALPVRGGASHVPLRAGAHVHSVRLPGNSMGIDVIFGDADQTLVLRHSTGNSAKPYVSGALLAIRHVSRLVGLHQGLERVLELPQLSHATEAVLRQ